MFSLGLFTLFHLSRSSSKDLLGFLEHAKPFLSSRLCNFEFPPPEILSSKITSQERLSLHKGATQLPMFILFHHVPNSAISLCIYIFVCLSPLLHRENVNYMRICCLMSYNLIHSQHILEDRKCSINIVKGVIADDSKKFTFSTDLFSELQMIGPMASLASPLDVS